jgi:hypothetical protein
MGLTSVGPPNVYIYMCAEENRPISEIFYFVLEKRMLQYARNQILLYVARSLYFQNPLELQLHTAPIVSLPKFHKCL